jgi:lipopolysaccharide export LptBFGC system permease protein LptF
MTFSELLDKERDAVARHAASPSRQNAENLRLTRAEIGERASLPLACLAVSIVAAPFAVRARRAGRSYSFAIGFLIIGAYYMIRLFVEPGDVRPLAECVFRAMTPNLVLAAVGIVALWRVDRV